LSRIVSGAIEFVVTRLLELAGDFLQAAYNLGAAIINGTVSAIKAAPGAIVTTVKYLFTNALGDLAGWLYSKGVAIWKYLKDGFTGASRQPIDLKPKVNLHPEDLKGAVAYAFGKESLGEKEPAEDKKLLAGPGKKGGEGKAESAALKQAKYELDTLKVTAESIKRIYDGKLADEEYYFNQSLKDLDSYTQARREAENQQFSALRATLEAEKKVLEVSRISRQERNVRTAQLNEQLAALEQRHQETLTKVDRDAQQHRLAAERQAW